MNKHWHSMRDQQDIVWLSIDHPSARTNLLNREALEQLDQALNELQKQPPKGLVIRSNKANGFIAGADVQAFTQVKTQRQAQQLLEQAHAIFNRLETLPFPTLALIHGFCMGGGTELALACDYRIAIDQDNTRIGLPEIRLGIHPGFGGCARAIRLIGPIAAMQMMLSGRAHNARRAKKLGLVDETVPQRHAEQAARERILTHKAARRAAFPQQLAHLPGIRHAIAWQLRKQAAKHAPPQHYPAPNALIRLWEQQGNNTQAMHRAEIQSVAKLIITPSAQNLVRLFFLNTRLKGLGRKADMAIQHVHIVGAGTMGRDIAAWCAKSGLRTTLQDQDSATLALAVKVAHGLFKKRLRDPGQAQAAQDRFIPDPKGHGIAKADVIIEAIYEDLEAKQSLFKQLEAQARPEALLATNTSSLPLEDIGQGLRHPERLIGLHFFNPVAKMQLLEVVYHPEQTDPERLKQGLAFSRHIDRLPLPVHSSPGFLINRVLMPYLMEAVRLLDEGHGPQTIDQAAKDFGMPVGPVELADRVGLDICLHVGNILSAQLPHADAVPESLKRKVEQGRLGEKSGQGYYRWQQHRPQAKSQNQQANKPQELKAITERLIDRLLNEAVACLREGIVADADLIDAGIVFGTGFAPFRGGPLHHAKQRGIDHITETLDRLREQQGERFVKDEGWAMLG